MPQPITHCDEFGDLPVELLGLGREPRPIDARPAIRSKHAGHFFERKPGGPPHGDEGQALDHAGIEQPPQAPSSHGADEPLLLVEAQRRRGDPAAARNLVDIQVGQDLTSS